MPPSSRRRASGSARCRGRDDARIVAVNWRETAPHPSREGIRRRSLRDETGLGFVRDAEDDDQPRLSSRRFGSCDWVSTRPLTRYRLTFDVPLFLRRTTDQLLPKFTYDPDRRLTGRNGCSSLLRSDDLMGQAVRLRPSQISEQTRPQQALQVDDPRKPSTP